MGPLHLSCPGGKGTSHMSQRHCTARLSARHNRPVRHERTHLKVYADDKMYVPGDSFGGKSPEAYMSERMRTFFTFVAVKVVISQMEGMGRGNLAAYNAESLKQLHTFLEENEVRDGDKWLAKFMRVNKMLSVRIAEVRDAYCEDDFEWENLRKGAVKGMKEGNLKIMREYAVESFSRQAIGAAEPDK